MSGITKMVEWLENNEEEIDGGVAFDMIYEKAHSLAEQEKARPVQEKEEGFRTEIERYALRFKNSNTCVGRLSVIWDDLSNILSRHPAPTDRQEALAVLADRKNCYYTVLCHKGEWDIQIYSHEEDSDMPVKLCDGVDTYAAAEAKARQYLDGLEDKK